LARAVVTCATTALHRSVGMCVALMLVACAASSASAVLLPVRTVDEFRFPDRAPDLHLMHVHMLVSRVNGGTNGAHRASWYVEADFVVANRSSSEITVPIALVGAIEGAEWSTIFVDGARIGSDQVRMRQDPARGDLVFPHGVAFQLTVPAEGYVTVRTQFYAPTTVDTYGRLFLELPTHVLAEWGSVVERGRIEVYTAERPMAMASTLTGGITYDEPEGMITWYLRDWRPSIPFRMSYLPTWSMLMTVTNVEACPDPWTVVRYFAQGDMSSAQDYIAVYDPGTLEFCASLPLVVHGYGFDDVEVRRQFGAIPLSRYVATADSDARLYTLNPHFQEAMLPDSEAIYRRALLNAAQYGSFRAPAPEPEPFEEIDGARDETSDDHGVGTPPDRDDQGPGTSSNDDDDESAIYGIEDC